MDDFAFRKLVDEVRERIDIATLIGETLELQPSGSVLKGRSPFNRDKDPSLVVWPHTGTWRDFSGGGNDGGDCFEFVQKRDGIGFMEALRLLATKVGIEVPGTDNPKVAEELRSISERRRVEDLLTAAAAYYHGVLPSKIREAWYHKKYGFNTTTIDTLLLGWADGHQESPLESGSQVGTQAVDLRWRPIAGQYHLFPLPPTIAQVEQTELGHVAR